MLKNWLTSASPDETKAVRLEARFETKKSKVVDVKMWYASDDEKSVDFIGDLGDYMKHVAEQIEFEPRFAFWNCPHCDDKFRDTHCVSNGKYCAMSSFNGKEKILEDLRQLCIWRKVDKEGEHFKFFKYLKDLKEFGGIPANAEASKNLMKIHNIDSGSIE